MLQITKVLPIKNLSFQQIFVGTLAASIFLGITVGYVLAQGNGGVSIMKNLPIAENPKNAQQDNQTFRDFADGVIQKRPAPKNPTEYAEGTHLLVREGSVPVALTSSVVDLSLYEGKKIKVYGETQKAIKEGWLMDVGKVEVQE